jgi:hypothetical protein
LKKKKLTNKEITETLTGLNSNDHLLYQHIQQIRQEVLETKQVFSLYLDHKGDTENFNKFIKKVTDEFEKKQSKDSGGA